MKINLKNFCTPSILYFLVSILTIISILFRNIKLFVLFVQITYIIICTFLLNLLCKKGHTFLSWIFAVLSYALLVYIGIYQYLLKHDESEFITNEKFEPNNKITKDQLNTINQLKRDINSKISEANKDSTVINDVIFDNNTYKVINGKKLDLSNFKTKNITNETAKSYIQTLTGIKNTVNDMGKQVNEKVNDEDNCTAGDPSKKIPPSKKWIDCNAALVKVKDTGPDTRKYWNEGNVCHGCQKVRLYETLRCNNGQYSDSNKPTDNWTNCNDAIQSVGSGDSDFDPDWWSQEQGCFQCANVPNNGSQSLTDLAYDGWKDSMDTVIGNEAPSVG